jgi:hypothetical protein
MKTFEIESFELNPSFWLWLLSERPITLYLISFEWNRIIGAFDHMFLICLNVIVLNFYLIKKID